MSLSSPIVFSGIQSVDFIDKSSKLPLGRLRVLQSVEMGEEVAKTDLTGGSQKSPWATSIGATTRTLTITANEFPSWLIELVSAGVKTNRSAEASGYASQLVESNSLDNAITGFTISVSDATKLKTGRYLIKATTAKIAKVYLVGANVDSANFSNDELEIFSIDLTTSTYVNAVYGLTFTEKGTANFTIGETNYFDVRAVNNSSYNITFGSESSEYKNVEIYVAGQLTSGQQAIVHIYNAQGAGMPISFQKDAFSEYSLEFSILYCDSKGGTHEIEYINTGSSSSC